MLRTLILHNNNANKVINKLKNKKKLLNKEANKILDFFLKHLNFSDFSDIIENTVCE